MNDREWDIFMMEMEAGNEEIIQEFLISQMRPRDQQLMVDQLNQLEEQELGIQDSQRQISQDNLPV